MNCDTPLAHPRDTIASVIATLIFDVSEPVPKNRTFARGKGKRLYRTVAGTKFRNRIAWCAKVAAKEVGWPTDLYIPEKVRVTVELFNGKWDAGACDTIVCDALSGVLYHDDRIASHGPAELPFTDEGGRRARVIVELLAVRTQAQADKLRTASEKRAVARLVNKSKTRKITITTKKRAM